ncbi:MAG: class I SAM-dependent methyltransferase [Rhizobiales bacterium]|nr:class I SAM-dependent methyltransferase [Hyphomicrobiales bacterium]
MSQKHTFLESEGDAWYERNRLAAIEDPSTEIILKLLNGIGAAPKRILEIGCSSGYRLAKLENAFGAECHGIDPSAKAIFEGKIRYPALNLRQGTADELNYDIGYFDLVFFGFCLYLCDPSDHFKIAWQTDRILAEQSLVIIKDFFPAHPHRNPYSHRDAVFSYKMDFSNMFLWHPAYSLLSRSYLEHGSPLTFDPAERVVTDLIRKDLGTGFPLPPRS